MSEEVKLVDTGLIIVEESGEVTEHHVAFLKGRISRDAEVAELKKRIKELEEPFAKLKEIAANMQSMPPEFAKIVDENFWELLV